MTYYHLNRPNGSVEAENTTRSVDSYTPGIIKANKHVVLTDVFGKTYNSIATMDSVIIYTDYSNVQLRYSCTTLNNFWFGKKFEYYFILVRNRSFDSIKTLVPLIQALKSLGIDLNTNMVLLPNQNCTN